MALSTLSLLALIGAVDVTSWEGVDCPASALLERLGSTPTTNPVRVAMRRRGAAYVGVVEVTRDGRVRSSVLEATTCAELIETLALRATLASAPEPRRDSPPAPLASALTPRTSPEAALPAEVHRRLPKATAPLRSTAALRPTAVAPDEYPRPPRMTALVPTTDEMRPPAVAAEAHPSTPRATALLRTTVEIRPPAVAAEAHPSTTPPTAPLPTTAEERLSTPPALTDAVIGSSAEADPVVSVEVTSLSAREVATPTVVKPDVHLELGASAVLLAGPAPVASFGGAAVLSVASARLPLRIELVLLHARTPTVVVGPATASFSVSLARLGLCGEPLRLGRLALGGCGAVAGGALWGRGDASDAITEPREVLLPWLDLSVSALAAFTLSASLRLVARLGPTFPITRHLFVFDSPLVRVHAVGPVGLEGGLGLVFAP